MSNQSPIAVLDSRDTGAPVPVHHLPCAFAVTGDGHEARVSGYFTPSIRETDVVLPSGEKGDEWYQLCV